MSGVLAGCTSSRKREEISANGAIDATTLPSRSKETARCFADNHFARTLAAARVVFDLFLSGNRDLCLFKKIIFQSWLKDFGRRPIGSV